MTEKNEKERYDTGKNEKTGFGWIWTAILILIVALSAYVLMVRADIIDRPNWFKPPIDNVPLVPDPVFPDGGDGTPDIDGDGEPEDDQQSDDELSDPNEIEESKTDMIMGDEGVSEGLGLQPFALKRSYPNSAVAKMNGAYVNNVIHWAHKYLGTPYEYGSNRNTPKTFDCSDFVRWTHLISIGYTLPADSRQQKTYAQTFGTRKFYDIKQAKKGDLLFFMSYKGYKIGDYKGVNPRNQTTTHVGISLGGGKMIHTASKASGGVRIDDVVNKHYQWRFQEGHTLLN